MTICMGIRHIARYATQLAKTGNGNSDVKASERAMVNAVAVTPRTGCFIMGMVDGLEAVEFERRPRSSAQA
jgi:hypothetical protein